MFNKFSFLCFGILALLSCIQASKITGNLRRREVRSIERDALMICGDKYHMDSQELYNFLRDWTLDAPISEDQKCMFGCVYEKLGVIENKKINWENLKQARKLTTVEKEQELELKIVEACENQVKDGEESCALAYTLTLCLKEELIKVTRNKMTAEEVPWFELSSTVLCQRKHNVTDEEAFGIIYNIPNKRNVKCMLRCLDEMLGYVNRSTKKYDWDYRVKMEHLRYSNKPDFVETAVGIVENCKKEVNTDIDDGCESSYLATDCYMKQLRKYL